MMDPELEDRPRNDPPRWFRWVLLAGVIACACFLAYLLGWGADIR